MYSIIDSEPSEMNKDHCEAQCNGERWGTKVSTWDQGFDDFIYPCDVEFWESNHNMALLAAEMNNYWEDDDDDDWDEDHHWDDDDHHWDDDHHDDGGCWDVLAGTPCGSLINGLSIGIFLLCAIFKF